jgi:type VI secretion system protein ImpG
MDAGLSAYRNRELAALERLLSWFTFHHPEAATRVGLAAGSPIDPSVRVLVQAFATLTALIRRDFDAAWDGLERDALALIDPLWSVPVPSLGILQLTHAGDAGLDRHVPRHTRVVSSSHQVGVVFRTTRDVVVWTVSVAEAGLASDGGKGLRLVLQIDPAGGPTFADLADLGFDDLELFLAGPPDVSWPLAEAMTARPTAARARGPADGAWHPVSVEAGVDSDLLAWPRRVFVGYRRLCEFFLLPAASQFVRLSGLGKAAAAARDRLEVRIDLAPSGPPPPIVQAAHFATGCVPVVNLFPVTTAVRAEPTRTEHLVVPDQRRPDWAEVYTVDAVREDGHELPALLNGRHDWAGRADLLAWHASRRADGRVMLRLSSGADDGIDRHLAVDLTCSNGAAAAQAVGGWQLADGTLRGEFRTGPTPSLQPAAQPRRLPGMLALHGMPVRDPHGSAEELRTLLVPFARLEERPEPEDDEENQRRGWAQRLIGAIRSASSERVPADPADPPGVPSWGRRVVIDLDARSCPGGSGFLFGRALDALLGLLTAPGSFTRLEVRTTDGRYHVWPARMGG